MLPNLGNLEVPTHHAEHADDGEGDGDLAGWGDCHCCCFCLLMVELSGDGERYSGTVGALW